MVYRNRSVGVVVPAYNEEGLVGDVIESIPAFVDRIYVIDDGSTDGTWAEIRSYAAESTQRLSDPDAAADQPPIESSITSDGGTVSHGRRVVERPGADASPDRRVVPIKHEENRGVGAAIKTGYQRALADDLDITVVMGGDGQMNPDLLPKFLNPIVDGDADYTKGNRLLYKEYRQEMSHWRFLGNAILTFLTKIASGYWKMMDPQNGYTAISNYALENVGIGSMYEYYGYCNDLLVKLNAKGMRIADVAMPAVYGDEESSIRYPAYIPRVSGMLLRNFFWRLKVKYLVLDFHPLALFYLFGTITTLVGVIGIGWAVYAKFILDHALFLRAGLGLLLFITGSMFLMFAMLFDMQVNKDKEVQIFE